MRLLHSPRRALAALAALGCGALDGAPLAAQVPRPARAFEPSVTTYIGMMAFGDRFTDPGGTYRYSSSLTAGVRADLPVTRRIGLLLDLGVAPLADQSVEDPTGDRVLGERAMAWRATMGLAWRFKPAAPVFAALGGGVFGASKPPAPQSSGSEVDPEAMFAIGYDGRGMGRWNVRGVYTGHVVFPGDPGRPSAAVKSRAYDWSLVLGLRYMLGGGAGERSTP